jgi:hypothetical protein
MRKMGRKRKIQIFFLILFETHKKLGWVRILLAQIKLDLSVDHDIFVIYMAKMKISPYTSTSSDYIYK